MKVLFDVLGDLHVSGVDDATLAFVLVCGLIVLKELFDDFIVDDADLERKLGIPALGVIPDMEG